MSKQERTIIFRHLGDNLPPGWVEGAHWQLECYGREQSYPLGVAWVMVPADAVRLQGIIHPHLWPPIISFVLVVDDYRCQGVGTQLVAAAQQRWPNARLGQPTGVAGLALFRKMSPPAQAEDLYSEDFIDLAIREGLTREALDTIAQELLDSRLPDSSNGQVGHTGESPVQSRDETTPT